jgi:hypothetical protein
VGAGLLNRLFLLDIWVNPPLHESYPIDQK